MRHVRIACRYSTIYCFADHVYLGFYLRGHKAEDLHVNLFIRCEYRGKFATALSEIFTQLMD